MTVPSIVYQPLVPAAAQLQASGGPGPSTDGYIKVWTGSAWELKPVKYWNGSTWAIKPVKYWNGSIWNTT
jgi:hypothetical protein